MSNLLGFKAKYSGKSGGIEANLMLIHFVDENNIHIIYSPHLDLSGYGKTKEEAQRSFEDSFADLIDYTINKKTLGKLLKQLGWKVKGNDKHPKELHTPSMSDILDKTYVSDILDKYNVETFKQRVQIPQIA